MIANRRMMMSIQNGKNSRDVYIVCQDPKSPWLLDDTDIVAVVVLPQGVHERKVGLSKHFFDNYKP